MDSRHFDALTKTLSEAGTRRGLLALLAALPMLGGLVALLDFEEADARKNRRKGRKKPHKRAKRRRKKQKQRTDKRKRTCRAHSRAKTCANRCGVVKNNCKKNVDCGSCDCTPTCEECFTCQGEPGVPGACVPQETGTPCGDPAICQDGTYFPQGGCDGSGACQPGTPVPCAPYIRCDGNACATTCDDDFDCVAGSFCNGEQQCVGDQETGQPCDHGGQCQSGFCVDGVCCASRSCPACQACNVAGDLGVCAANPDRVGDACGISGQVCQANGSCACQAGSCTNPAPICGASGLCAGCGSGSDCTAAGAGNLCCAGSCFTGICCADAACATEEAPDCVGHDCVCAANGNAACPADETCCDDGCADLDTDADNCGSCGDPCSGTTPICDGGSCVACSAAKPCPAGQCCAADGSCGANCPPCHACAGGVCVADASQDGSCCAGAAGGRWCQAGACVPIPTDTGATLAECGGRCYCEPYGDNSCGSPDAEPWPAYQEICGVSRPCPLCEQCAGLASGCDGTGLGDGQAGYGFYCIFEETVGSCHPQSCPDPQSQVCIATRCLDICGVAAG